jgi:hypothetical protein
MSTQQDLTPERVLAEIGYPQFVAGLFSRDKGGDLSKDFTHAVLGIATEVRELRNATDDVNALEEKGDLVFYGIALAVVVQDIIGLAFSDDQWESFTSYVDEIHEQCAINEIDPFDFIDDAVTHLLDQAKRWVGYGRKPEDFVQTTREALGLISFAVEQTPWDHEDPLILLANVAKLIDRYKGLKFDAERAINRDTAAERTLLEQHAA